MAHSLKSDIKSLIMEGKTNKEVLVIHHSISPASVQRYRKEVEDEQRGHHVDAVSNLDPEIVLTMANRLEEHNPKMAKDLTHLANGLDSLAKLEPTVHQAVGEVITLSQEAMREKNIKSSEFKMYAELILKCYATLYNRPSTQINVNQTQNNAVIQDAVTERLNSLTAGLFDDKDTIVGEIK